MQSFDADRHEFTVRGKKYYLEPLDFGDATQMATLEGKTVPEQVAALGALLEAKARADKPNWLLRLLLQKTPAAAVRSLSMGQQAQLFQGWLRGNAPQFGVVMPGESSGSAK